MVCSFRCLLIGLAVLVTTSGTAASPKPRPHHVRPVPINVPRPRVSHHPRPAVHRIPVHHARNPATRIVRQPVRRTAIRTVHRYPVHRLPRRFVRRPHHFGHRRYSYSYYPGRYRWRSNHYNRGRSSGRRGIVGGIVESVQGNLGNGTLLVKVHRSRSSRFRYARNNAAGRGATSLRRFHLNGGTLYQVMTIPPRVGTMADLRRGERVLIQTHPNTGHTAQKVVVSPGRRR